MIAIKKGERTTQIVACNTHEEEGEHQLWVEKPTGRTVCIARSTSKEEIQEIKDAIDYAISKGERMLELND